jgi:TonB family protein
MESHVMLKYENMYSNALPDKTQTGGVKHNEGIGLETEGRLSARAFQRPESSESAALMANDLLNHPNTESQTATVIAVDDELNISFGAPVEEKPIWVTLYESLRDIFFPPKLPPLKLTSKPIPVPDRMAVKRNWWAYGAALFLNGAILLVVIFLLGRAIIKQIQAPSLVATTVDVGDFKAPKAKVTAGGGGGGGDHSIVDPSKGKLPKFEKNPPLPPQVQALDHPKLAMEAAINVQKTIMLPDNPMMPNIGVKNSVNVRLASNGQGGGGGIGSGYGGGIGSGTGNGYGPGRGGNTGGGLERIGGGVSEPKLVYSIDPEFSDEARRNKYQGKVIVSIIVDVQGNPQNPRVVRALGEGLDEKAIEAIKQYRFKPAMKNGKPVPVMMNVEIDFRLY